MKIREAEKKDLEDLFLCHRDSILATPESLCSMEQKQAWTHKLSAGSHEEAIEKHLMLVAEENNEVIGFSEFNPSNKEFCACYVKPNYWEKGVGKKLVLELLKKIDLMGVRRIWLKSSKMAHGFYQKCGFEDKEIMIHTFEGIVKMEVYHMERKS